MADDISPEVKLFMMEQLSEFRKENDAKLEKATRHGTAVFTAIAALIAILTSLGVWQFGTSSVETAVTKWFQQKGFTELDTNAHRLVRDIQSRSETAEIAFSHIQNFERNLLGQLPIGSVVAFVGETETLGGGVQSIKGNANWLVCNGATYDGRILPDLRDRFVKGLKASERILSMGGKNSSTHTHSGTSGQADKAGPSQGAREGCNNSTTLPELGHKHAFTTGANSDESDPYNNTPAFISLYYVIKVR
jgi:hypothetical protein